MPAVITLSLICLRYELVVLYQSAACALTCLISEKWRLLTRKFLQRGSLISLEPTQQAFVPLLPRTAAPCILSWISAHLPLLRSVEGTWCLSAPLEVSFYMTARRVSVLTQMSPKISKRTGSFPTWRKLFALYSRMTFQSICTYATK